MFLNTNLHSQKNNGLRMSHPQQKKRKLIVFEYEDEDLQFK